MSNRYHRKDRDLPYEPLASQLWDITKTDWNVRISHILTEPTCCYVDLFPDDEACGFKGVKGFIGTSDINQSVANAIAYVLASWADQGLTGKSVTPTHQG